MRQDTGIIIIIIINLFYSTSEDDRRKRRYKEIIDERNEALETHFNDVNKKIGDVDKAVDDKIKDVNKGLEKKIAELEKMVKKNSESLCGSEYHSHRPRRRHRSG